MTSKQTGGSTTHKPSEWCRYLREKKGLVSTMPSEARNFAAIADHIGTLTAENERLTARVERLEGHIRNALLWTEAEYDVGDWRDEASREVEPSHD